eukprot:2728417-Rhodomonas_salina.1
MERKPEGGQEEQRRVAGRGEARKGMSQLRASNSTRIDERDCERERPGQSMSRDDGDDECEVRSSSLLTLLPGSDSFLLPAPSSLLPAPSSLPPLLSSQAHTLPLLTPPSSAWCRVEAS